MVKSYIENICKKYPRVLFLLKRFNHKNERPLRKLIILLMIFFLFNFVFCLTNLFGEAQNAEELAIRYSPVLRFTGNEKFYPTTIDYFISRASLFDHSNGATVDSSPTPETLGSYVSTNLYLNHDLETFEAIASDYSLQAELNGYHIYAKVAITGSSTVIQYWLFYVFNNGPLNDHQGDFEVIEVFLDSSDNPQITLYSQHFTGQNTDWNEVEKIDTHPVVYVAEGSHANYFRSYQGKIGFESDIVGNDGLTINFDRTSIIMLQDQSWLNFAGRWGYWGTEAEVALGRAGPHGPVFNQDGIRWAQPEEYLSQTLTVNGTYFIIAWFAANFLLLFVIYLLGRGGWKIFNIYRMIKKGRLGVWKFLKSKGAIFLVLGIISILIAFFALFLPWYIISASSETSPLAQEEPVDLMKVDGVNGVSVNLFFGSAESTSGYRNVFSTQLPFSIIFVAGLVLLILDIIAIKSGPKLGRKFIIGAIISLIPFILILVFIAMLPTFLPWASMLLPGQELPPQLETMVTSISTNPIAGTTSQSFEVVGITTVNWGFSLGAYLFLFAAILRIISGVLLLGTGEFSQTIETSQQKNRSTPKTKSKKNNSKIKTR
jgi:hypothetical protein